MNIYFDVRLYQSDFFALEVKVDIKYRINYVQSKFVNLHWEVIILVLGWNFKRVFYQLSLSLIHPD